MKRYISTVNLIYAYTDNHSSLEKFFFFLNTNAHIQGNSIYLYI